MSQYQSSQHSSKATFHKPDAAFWKAHVKAWQGSGLNRAEYYRRHNLSYHSLTDCSEASPCSGDINGDGIVNADDLYIFASEFGNTSCPDDKFFYFHNDHLGTPQRITDQNGTISNPFRFPGQYYDAETGLHYNYYRYYDPEIGRYLRADPIGLAGGINLYAYVHNDPVNAVDPWGLSPDWFSCWARCIEKHRFDPAAALAALGSALPKKAVPPFRVVNQNQRLTTPLSTAAHYVGEKAPVLASKMRWAGRGISRVATPLLISEGFYDIGVIAYCAEKCNRDEPCQN